MGRVAADAIERLSQIMAVLDGGDTKACRLCNETLTHNIKQIEANTGASERAVCEAIADKINETALPQDKVTGESLRQRVKQHDGSKARIGSIGTNRKPTKEEVAAKKEEKRIFEANQLIFAHAIEPMKALTTCELSPKELYLLFPEYMIKYFKMIDGAVNFLTELKEVHDGDNNGRFQE